MLMLKGALQSETSGDSSLLYSVGQLIYTAFGSQPNADANSQILFQASDKPAQD